MSNSLNPYQDRRFLGPDLGPNCLQSLSADDYSSGCLARNELIQNRREDESQCGTDQQIDLDFNCFQKGFYFLKMSCCRVNQWSPSKPVSSCKLVVFV